MAAGALVVIGCLFSSGEPPCQICIFHPTAGADVAEPMLDFIEWLTQQDFGRRCILSVRDVLSWVHFLNAVSTPGSFLRAGALEETDGLDSVTAFVHAACLVYVDGIGSGELTASPRVLRSEQVSGCGHALVVPAGTTASCADDALAARQTCLDFLQQRLRKVTRLDQQVMDNLRLYDCSLLREPRWGEDFFGIEPFYVALGVNLLYNICLTCQSEKEWCLMALQRGGVEKLGPTRSLSY